ncbi:MAG: ATP-binding protein [Thermoleophilaceae bacterium]
MFDSFSFAAHGEFLDRAADLERLEDWWSGKDRNALALFGRRRVGKSWLFREFAHGKPALILVSERRAEGAQLIRFADRLEPLLGLRPDLPDVAALFSALYALAEDEKALVIIDEFPYLLPTRARDREGVLTAVQAVMEDRDSSQLKLVLCGSHIGQMATLLAEESPIRGRLTPLAIDPLRFNDAQEFVDAASAKERIERFAVAGGMSLYLDELGRGGSLRNRICERVLNHRGPLFNDPREVLEEELRQPGIYFSVLEELAARERSIGDLASAIGAKGRELGPYLKTLRVMQLVEQIAPVTAGREFRHHRFRVADGFLRFWFRFVFSFQEDLRTGLLPSDHYDGEIEPVLADHVAPVFESLCREWTRRQLGRRASRVGSWWGNALNKLRQTGQRQIEEVDVVGLRRSSVTIVGECKWTSRAVTPQVLTDLETYKIPAMRQAKLKFANGGPMIVLFSRSGFNQNLIDIAAKRRDLQLIELDQIIDGLAAG